MLREFNRAFHLFWNADEMGPPRQSADGDGFFLKHIETIALLCVDFSPKFRTEASDVSLFIVHIRLSTQFVMLLSIF